MHRHWKAADTYFVWPKWDIRRVLLQSRCDVVTHHIMGLDDEVEHLGSLFSQRTIVLVVAVRDACTQSNSGVSKRPNAATRQDSRAALFAALRTHVLTIPCLHPLSPVCPFGAVSARRNNSDHERKHHAHEQQQQHRWKAAARCFDGGSGGSTAKEDGTGGSAGKSATTIRASWRH